MMRYWDHDAHRYIEAEPFNCTGPEATYCLLSGEGRHQRYADLLSGRCGASRGELPTCKEAGTRNEQKRAQQKPRRQCSCGNVMGDKSARCRDCHTRSLVVASWAKVAEKSRRECGCGRAIARSSTLNNCATCRQHRRRVKR